MAWPAGEIFPITLIQIGPWSCKKSLTLIFRQHFTFLRCQVHHSQLLVHVSIVRWPSSSHFPRELLRLSTHCSSLQACAASNGLAEIHTRSLLSSHNWGLPDIPRLLLWHRFNSQLGWLSSCTSLMLPTAPSTLSRRQSSPVKAHQAFCISLKRAMQPAHLMQASSVLQQGRQQDTNRYMGLHVCTAFESMTRWRVQSVVMVCIGSLHLYGTCGGV